MINNDKQNFKQQSNIERQKHMTQKNIDKNSILINLSIALADTDTQDITRANICRGPNKVISESIIEKIFGNFSAFKTELLKALKEKLNAQPVPESEEEPDFESDFEEEEVEEDTDDGSEVAEEDEDWDNDEAMEPASSAKKYVKVFLSNGNAVRIMADANDSVQDVLEATGVESLNDSDQIRVNGEVIPVDEIDFTECNDKDIISVSKKIKGNADEVLQKKVKVFDSNGDAHFVRIEQDATLGDIIESVGLNLDAGYTVTVNSTTTTDMDMVPEHKSIITLATKIKGNAEAYVRVKLIESSGNAQLLRVPQGTTLETILEDNDVQVDRGVTVMVNGTTTNDYTVEVEDKTIITVAEKIKGNR
jgi:hypothetical protein